ncbi:1-acyl-sn-glycerol-3-phosphate acyltransferase [Puniceicoccales bacterium CK1056]|uniref:1-acyl-sn-glycerol-3-phosphate acyltransferase n=1 Tax=Oceanipulchritudo coccoides TaxID=2706888 RepID=A0A6B2M464_9BACT|nr:lysophospholipid acyltransferase family protein [Oceanipulchritudo coccoides]NDV63092.1 1-acyl-sn-glycerol-3-phosphate acyltransferase [Oceanipulchritudo coccoides]
MRAREAGLQLIASFIRLVCGVRPLTGNSLPPGPKVFYANHTSHLDFTLIWAVLPQAERLITRPVAGKDYWIRNKVTRFVGCDIFNALLIERKHITRANNPIEQMHRVLESGLSLIVFPEGTRGTEPVPAAFRSGLYHLSMACPDIPMIPVYLENLNRMLPKGTILPIPLISRITVGSPLPFKADHGQRDEFLTEARQALIDLPELESHE